jgi:hypothetical protein
MDTPTTTKTTPAPSALAEAIRDSMSPDAVATMLCYLQAADFGNRPDTERGRAAVLEVLWLVDELRTMLGVEQHDRLIDELGL